MSATVEGGVDKYYADKPPRRIDQLVVLNDGRYAVLCNAFIGQELDHVERLYAVTPNLEGGRICWRQRVTENLMQDFPDQGEDWAEAIPAMRIIQM
ncbi:hypothetical protein ACFL2Q_14365 [Thermodesulfobacteriota bacterium]